MQPTRRLWASVGLALALAVLALVIEATPLALGAVAIGVWLLTRQLLFSRAVLALQADLTVEQSPARRWLQTDESIPVTLTATLTESSRLTATIAASLPPAATTTESLTLTLSPGETEASETATVGWPVAGTHSFDKASLVVSDGLFRQTLTVGSSPSVTVEPHGPRTVHVGEGGEIIASAYGVHELGRHGSGIEPAELREYQPGDTLKQIDWNATARLGTPYVREFDAETDRTTLLVVDHRASLGEGAPGETKLDYLREVALAVAGSAHRQGDPLGLLTVDDEGITEKRQPSTTATQYTDIRRRVLDIAPRGDEGDVAADPDTTRAGGASRGALTGAEIRRDLATLTRDQGPFERALKPFYADRQFHRRRFERAPLYGALQETLAGRSEPVFTVLCTDDSEPVELRETVQLARQEGGGVLVLLAPSVLYEPGGLADPDRAFERYVAFEELRRDLATLDRVTALEVAPGDRLATVLDAGRRGRAVRGGESA